MNKYILVILMLLNVCAFGQEKEFTGDPDKAFEVARELAFNKQRKQAQDTLKLILTKYPNYNDVRSFLASTYSWDGEYEKAREEFDYVLNNDADRLETWKAAINNELWRDDPNSALKMTNDALTHFPKNPELLYLKASAEDDLENPEQALKTIDELLKENPDDEKAKSFRESLNIQLSRNVIGLKSSLDLYSEVYDPMQYYLVKYVRQTKYGSIHAKLNISNRFSSTGAQVEVDMYPKITKGLYAYVNFGVSNSTLYPDIRYGAELYKSLPKSFEVSAGFRALIYSETTTIFTGSLGWYTGNSFWSLRSYITPDDSGTSISGTLNYRKYRSDADNYFSIDVGMGFSPEIYRFYFDGNENTIVNLNSQKLNLGYYFTSKNKINAWGFQAGISHQEISFDPGSYLWIYSLGASWDIKFK